MKKVLVTGANGHLGNNLVRLLIEEGYDVRASVRDLGNPKKTAPLQDLGVSLVEADILKPETLPAAVADRDGVFHVAAAYVTWAKDPQREIIDPSVKGAENVLGAAADAGVKKVVLTSSCAAIGLDATLEDPMTEEDWNDDAVNPYAIAKTEAERRAWALSKERGFSLVTINPSGIIGPGFYRHTPTTEVFDQLLRGALPAIPPLGFAYVDVRDVARAHLLAYEKEEAEGRYICSTRYCKLTDLVEILRKLRPNVAFPRKELPAMVLPVLAALDWVGYKVAGRPRTVTKDMLEEYLGKQQHVSTAKLRGLGWEPMDFETSVEETVAWVEKTCLGAET